MKGNFFTVYLVFLFSLFSPCPLQAEVDIFGYFENRLFVVENPEESWEKPGEKLRLGDYNRLRLKYKASPSKKVTVNVAVDFYSYHGMIDTWLWPYIGPTTPTGSNVRIDLDRAYLDLYFKRFDISIGKQRVALGVSYLWAPLDVFNRVNIFEPKEEKPGVNAFKVYIPLGTFSGVTVVFSPDMKVNASTSALRSQVQVFGVDAAFTLLRFGTEETTIYGLDLRGENLIGWWAEAGYFVSPHPDNTNIHQKDLKLVLGFDYTFPLKRGLYWMNEFFYDSSGEKDPHTYDYIPLFTGKRFTLGKYYLFSMLSYSFTDFISASISYIANWGDGSFLLNPMIYYEITQDIRLTSGFYLPIGPQKGEFKNFKENTFFIWLKVSF
ncbi:MAG: hypothetical protein JSV88_28190 [Candidatus Aminicenantes bacterium]|nr:MAG: hypothetical protein JSV88_28190 [Candidatus Aminicenantes bacterium]